MTTLNKTLKRLQREMKIQLVSDLSVPIEMKSLRNQTSSSLIKLTLNLVCIDSWKSFTLYRHFRISDWWNLSLCSTRSDSMLMYAQIWHKMHVYDFKNAMTDFNILFPHLKTTCTNAPEMAIKSVQLSVWLNKLIYACLLQTIYTRKPYIPKPKGWLKP